MKFSREVICTNRLRWAMDSHVAMAGRLVLIGLHMLADDDNVVRAHLHDIVAATGVGFSTVKHSLAVLERSNLISRGPMTGARQRGVLTFEIRILYPAPSV
jgi:hypothetical protein